MECVCAFVYKPAITHFLIDAKITGWFNGYPSKSLTTTSRSCPCAHHRELRIPLSKTKAIDVANIVVGTGGGTLEI